MNNETIMNSALVSTEELWRLRRVDFIPYILFIQRLERRVSLLAAPHLPKNFFQEVLCKACQGVPGHCLAARSLNNLNYFRLCVLQSPGF